MYWFYCSALVVVAVVVLCLLWYYPNPQTTLFVRLVVGLAWFDSLSVLVLVPIDVSRALLADDADTELYRVSDHALGAVWAAVYFSTLAFLILVLPFLKHYSDSGGFSIRQRVSYALERSVGFLLLAAAVLLAGFLILLVLEGDLSFGKFVGWIMAVLNAYGLIGAICLVGYGLVDIPRALWRKAHHTQRQNFLFQTAGIEIEKAAKAHLELSKQINSVQRVDRGVGQLDQMRPYMDIVVSMLERVPYFQPQETEEDVADIQLETHTPQGLGILRRRLKKAIEGWYRERERYLTVVHEYLRLHETMENQNRRDRLFVHANGRKARGCCTWYWRCRIKPIFQRCLALVTAALSALVVLAEITIADFLPNLSAFSRIFQQVTSDVLLICLTFLALLYVLTCMYYTLIRLGQFSFYCLVPKHTASSSLTSNALLLCRFVCPLCFNFFTAIALPIKDDEDKWIEESQFWDRIGDRISDMPVLGKHFTTIIPVFTLPYVLLIAFNGVNLVMSVVDPKRKLSFSDDWVVDMSSSYAATGRRVLSLEVEYCQRDWEPGLTITEGLRLAGVEDDQILTSAVMGQAPTPFSPSTTRSMTPVPLRQSHPEHAPLMRRASSLDEGGMSSRMPALPNTLGLRRASCDVTGQRVTSPEVQEEAKGWRAWMSAWKFGRFSK